VLHYSNWERIKNGIVVILTSRLGDFALFLFLGGLLLQSTSEGRFVLGRTLLLIGAGLTKSAQFPFGAWLPKAIAAPTPVSALIHSSTLVVAGLVLLLKFYFFIRSNLLWVLTLLAGWSVITRSLAATGEADLKKVVALSTLSQIGLIGVALGGGFVGARVTHLTAHAFLKRGLFLGVGVVIHTTLNQIKALQGGVAQSREWNTLGKIITLGALVGLFTMRGNLSKEGIVEREATLTRGVVLGY
jgi:NADH:ubiquinone oxidoreductase subunit 5 (subunit L)/multisubunit Na+/H+ antiporter MnhA subunit